MIPLSAADSAWCYNVETARIEGNKSQLELKLIIMDNQVDYTIDQGTNRLLLKICDHGKEKVIIENRILRQRFKTRLISLIFAVGRDKCFSPGIIIDVLAERVDQYSYEQGGTRRSPDGRADEGV